MTSVIHSFLDDLLGIEWIWLRLHSCVSREEAMLLAEDKKVGEHHARPDSWGARLVSVLVRYVEMIKNKPGLATGKTEARLTALRKGYKEGGEDKYGVNINALNNTLLGLFRLHHRAVVNNDKNPCDRCTDSHAGSPQRRKNRRESTGDVE